MKVFRFGLYFIAAVAQLNFATTAPAYTPGEQCYAASAAITLAGADGLQRLALPLPILQASQSRDLADVRILNAAQQPVAFAWAGSAMPATPAARQITLPQFVWPESKSGSSADTRGLHIEVQTDGSVLNITRAGTVSANAATAPRWLLDLNALQKQVPDALVVYWKNTGAFVTQAVVEASSDAQQWQQVGSATLVQVLGNTSTQPAIEQRQINLRALDASIRYLRIDFSDAPASGGLQLDHIDAKIFGDAAPLAMDTAKFTAVANADSGWLLDLGGAIDVRQLQVELPQNNSVLPLDIAQRAAYSQARTHPEWVIVSRTTAYRLSRDGREIVSPPVDIAAAAAREWRFTGVGASVPAMQSFDVRVSWLAPQLIFATQGEGPFAIVAGCANAKSASLERRTLLPDYRERDEYKLALATVGNVTVQASPDRLLKPAPETWRRWLLWAVLILATVGLGVLARKLLRELN